MKSNSDFFSQIRALLPVFMVTLTFGCNISWLMNAAYYLIQPKHVPSATASEFAYIASFHEIGRILFAIPSGYFIDKFGPKKLILVLGFLNFISWFTLIFTHDLVIIYCIRLCLGVGTALCSCLYVIMISELASAEYRGTLSTINQLALPVSGLTQSLISVAFSSYRAIVVGSAILCALFFPSCYYLLESPYYLLRSGQPAQAERNLRRLRPSRTAPQVAREFEKLSASMRAELSTRARLTFWQFVGARSVRQSLACGILVNVLHRCSGSPTMLVFMTVVLPANEYVHTRFYPLITVVVSLAVQLFSAAIIEKFPRRRLYAVVAALSFLALSWCAANFYLRWYEQHELLRISLIAAYLFVIISSVTFLAPLTDVVTSELFPYTIKGKACGIVMFCRGIALIFSYKSFDAVSTYVGVYANFVFFALSSLCLIVVILVLVPETRGKTLAQVQCELGTISDEKVRSTKSPANQTLLEKELNISTTPTVC